MRGEDILQAQVNITRDHDHVQKDMKEKKDHSEKKKTVLKLTSRCMKGREKNNPTRCFSNLFIQKGRIIHSRIYYNHFTLSVIA